MKPAPFDYARPDTVADAVALLASRPGDCKLLAGGQSLLPMLNFRVVRPGLLVDIGRLIELDYQHRSADGGLTLGALTRHRTLESAPLVAAYCPIVPAVMAHVAHLAIRNRGTLGGSLSHADPAAELPMLARLLDATIVAVSPRGERAIAAADFFIAPLTTCLQDDEMVVRVHWPAVPANTGWGFEEHARRPGDYALAAVATLLQLQQGRVQQIRIAMMGVGDTPMRCPAGEAVLAGQAPDAALIQQAATAACQALLPRSDLHASADLRRHLARVLCVRALTAAWHRACEPTS